MNENEKTMAERHSTYGSWDEQAKIAQQLKRVMHHAPNWNKFTDQQRETLDMLCNKFSRFLNGDPTYEDTVHDLSCYLELMLTFMRKEREWGESFEEGK